MDEFKKIKEEEKLIITDVFGNIPKDREFDETINLTHSVTEMCDKADLVDFKDLTADELLQAIDLTGLEGDFEIYEESLSDPAVKLSCELCKMKFVSSSNMYRHLRTKRHKILEAVMYAQAFNAPMPDLFGLQKAREKTIQDNVNQIQNDPGIGHQAFPAHPHQFQFNNNVYPTQSSPLQLHNQGFFQYPMPVHPARFNPRNAQVIGNETFTASPFQSRFENKQQMMHSIEQQTFPANPCRFKRRKTANHQTLPASPCQFEKRLATDQQTLPSSPIRLKKHPETDHLTLPASPCQFENQGIAKEINQESSFSYKLEKDEDDGQYKVVLETIKYDGVDLNSSNVDDNILEPMENQASQKVFQCAICNRNFSSRSNLTRHTNLHFPKAIFKCDYCPKTFKQREYWKKHSYCCRWRQKPAKTKSV